MIPEEATNTDPGVQGDTNATPTGEETQSTTDEGLMGNEPDATPPADGTVGGLMGDDAGGDAEGDTPDATPTAAPETYDSFDVSAGEDIGYKFTDEQFDSFSGLAKEIGLPQEMAQKIVEFDIARQKELIKADTEANKVQIEEWQAEARKEHGDKYKEVLASAKKVWDSPIIPKEFRDLLTATKLNYNPHVLRLFNNISKHISEDVFVPAEGSERTKEKSLQDKFSYVDKEYGK
jgi:hypothetical protein